MHSKTVGSTWVWVHDGKDWPVMLCGDDIPPKAFVDTRRDSGESAAILLGRRKYLWVIEARLQEYDPHRDYLASLPPFKPDIISHGDDDETKLEKQRRIAFRQDAPAWETPQYWKNYLDNQREMRRLERETSGSSSGKKKRKRSTNDKDDDDDPEIIEVRSSGSSLSPSKKRTSPAGRGSKNERQLPTPGQTPVKSKSNNKLGSYSGLPIRVRDGGIVEYGSDGDDDFFRSARPEEDPSSDDEKERKIEELRQKHVQSVIDNPPKHGVFTIFVGNSKTPFQATRDAVGQSEVLSGRTQFTDELGNYVDISEIEDVSPKDFVPVSEYLQNGDFGPRLIQKKDSLPRIDGLIISEQRNAAAEKCAFVFRTASHLQLGGLQSLCVNKLKVLYPLTPLLILIVAKIYQMSDAWGCDAETEFLDWLVDHISEYYWSLTAKHGERLVEALDSSEDLKRKVMEKISADPKMGRMGLDDDDF